jgi:hypothetical protein
VDSAERGSLARSAGDDDAEGRQNRLERRIGQVGKEVVTPEKDQREQNQITGHGANPAGESMVPTSRSRHGGWPVC